MRVLVYPHSMEIGGSQLNAIELGAATRELGHEVLVMSEPGPMVDLVHDLGLEHLPVPLRRRRPSPEVIGYLVDEVRRRRIDLVHGHEWPPATEAFLGPRLRLGVPAVATVMSASVAPFLPRRMPLVVGTEQLRRQMLARQRKDVTLIAPPVDVNANHPSFGPAGFRSTHGLAPDGLLVVVCCRLVRELKLEGLLAACEAVADLSTEGYPVQLVIVGDGAERSVVAQAAEQANARAGRVVVALTGELPDPRPAYAAADVVLGMGGSALRGMAFAKPLVVQGELGFWQVCRPGTVHDFLTGGWYGRGPGDDGVARLKAQLVPLLRDPGHRRELGAFSRNLVVEHFGLEAAARIQTDLYHRVIAGRRPAMTGDLTRLALSLPVHKFRRRIDRWRGEHAVDDFNSLAVMRPDP